MAKFSSPAKTGSGPVNRVRADREPGSSPKAKGVSSATNSPSVHKPASPVASKSGSKTGNSNIASPWSPNSIIPRLAAFRRAMGKTHGQLARHTIETATVADRRVHTGEDLFSTLAPADAPSDSKTLKMKIKHADKSTQAKDFRSTQKVVGIKTIKPAVPRYFNHPVQVGNNVVAPQTPMAFYPHKGDLDTPRKQKKWKGYIKDLDNSEASHGLDSIKLDEKRPAIIRYERTVWFSMYLGAWLKELAITDLNKWSLLKYMTAQNGKRDWLTPSQKGVIAHISDKTLTTSEEYHCNMFAIAWKKVFSSEKTKHGLVLGEVDLLQVLLHDKELKAFGDDQEARALEESDSEPDTPRETAKEYKELETTLQTYSSLGCLICFRHSCEHGFFTDDNENKRFALGKGWLARRLTEKMGAKELVDAEKLTHDDTSDNSPCKRTCYQTFPSEQNGVAPTEPFTDAEKSVLKAIFMSASSSLAKSDPICHAAVLLDRQCYEIKEACQHLSLAVPKAVQKPAASDTSSEPDEVPNLSWYNRFEHKLSRRPGAARHHVPNWDHINRAIDDVCALRGCDHDGPCEPSNPHCPCAKKGQLCEKYCGCTVENCAYKFTGCDCGLRGKSCHMKGEECICVQLNRECDPDLCHSCGVLERADPANAGRRELFAAGCQNCSLQRGSSKDVVLGKSQFHGYGLYAAEHIRKDDFIIEYVGELVSGEEGDRRYIRRQNLFDGTKPLSFNFTLLKECNVWIDGARFGNLSRYINHADGSTQKCNVMPRILLVNGSFRIAFRAKRNIKPWEELLFDYGEDFGLDSDKGTGKKRGKASGSRKKFANSDSESEIGDSESSGDEEEDEEEDGEDGEDGDDGSNSGSEASIAVEEAIPSPRKRKRSELDSSDDEEYAPSGSESHKTSRRAKQLGSSESQQQRKRMRGFEKTTNGSVKASTEPKVRHPRKSQASATPTARNSTSQSGTPALTEPAKKRRHLTTHIVISDSETTSYSGKPSPNEEEGVGQTIQVEDKVEVEVEVEVEDESLDDDDDEDGNSMKRDQPTRNRRTPAKFKDDELYDFVKRRRTKEGVSEPTPP